MNFPDINPVILYIGPIAIRWYSLSYIMGIMFGWLWFGKIQTFSMTKKQLDSMLSYIVIGVVVGARLGMLFYEPITYWHNPLLIIKVWEGGMSFHGGLIGVIICLCIFCKKNNISVFPVLDLAACFAPIGLFFGRIANFINGELWGRVTNMPWGVIFPHAGSLPRHPSQIYEALCEGLILFLVMITLLFKTKARNYPGLMSGIMSILYATARISIEFYREPDLEFCYSYFCITLGQLLSVPMIIIGILFIIYSQKSHTKINETM
ncbi:MAG: prolipoprotein diacylglyceryl transferase [Rickettsiaceae bacterium H1]|nr:prolipoprotein diacylglyceryl transferase [Rickettsiaceae bacterium H1]